MPVKIEWHGDQFEQAFFAEIGKEMEKAQNILSQGLRTALQSAGKGSKRPPVHSPPKSKIPYTITGTLARSWSVQKTKRKGDKFVSKIGTGVKYAIYLLRGKGSGRRNFLDARLGWRRKTLKMILARLDSRRLVAAAVRSLR